MANFSVSWLSPRGIFNLTNYNAENGIFIGNTFDEKITDSVDGQSFSFSMLKYRYEGTEKIVNTAALRILYGSTIQVDHNGRSDVFFINKIDYTFLSDNIQLNFSGIDYFQAIASKIGVGYTITDDIEDASYLGAQSIDDWARRIVRETNLDWTYVGIDSANDADLRYLASNYLDIEARDDILHPENWEDVNEEYMEIMKQNPATYNVVVSYSCSNSNAYAALKELGSQNEYILRSDYFTRRFWFIPRKKVEFRGYYVRPTINLQDFTLSGNGENLTTVLNVTGPEDIEGNEITLVPSLPVKVQQFIDSNAWETSVFSTNLYTDLYKNDPDVAAYASFLRQINQIPWLENKLINFDYFRNHLLLNYEVNDINNILQNKLRIINGRLMNAYRSFFTDQEKWMRQINELESEAELVTGHLVADIQTWYDELFNVARFTTEANSLPWPFIPIQYEKENGDRFFSMGRYKYSNDNNNNDNNDDEATLYGIPNGEESEAPISFDDSAMNGLTDTHLNSYQQLYWKYESDILTDRLQPSSIVRPTVFTSIIELLTFYKKVQSFSLAAVTDLDSFLQDRISAKESLYQLLLENIYKFKDYLEKEQDFFVQFRKVGVVTTTTSGQISADINNESDTAFVRVGDKINSISDDVFTQSMITALETYYPANTKTGTPAGSTRNTIIGRCANFEATLTQYWNVIRSTGMKLGFFFPTSWNCLDIIENEMPDFLTAYLWLLPLKYNDSTKHYYLNDNYDLDVVATKDYPQRYKYYDQQKQILYPLRTSVSLENRATTNTDINYELVTGVTDTTAINSLNIDNTTPYYKAFYQNRQVLVDSNQLSNKVQLFKTKLKYKTSIYSINDTNATRTRLYSVGEVALRLCGPKNPLTEMSAYPDFSQPELNPTLTLLYWLNRQEVAGTNYYKYQLEHNKQWQYLFAHYPAVFRESEYKNETATNSAELYMAAQAQLTQLSQPEFAYTMTALDIYMYNQDLMPMRIEIGDQIRIDYQDEAGRQDTINKALREILFVTGITHTLRTDGDYQFTVETRRATDIMVQRFAQLLSVGR